jgi:hypothetical protein
LMLGLGVQDFVWESRTSSWGRGHLLWALKDEQKCEKCLSGKHRSKFICWFRGCWGAMAGSEQGRGAWR